MKNIIKSAFLLVVGLGLFTSCETDIDNNPVFQTPNQFELNTPALAAQTIDLANSSTVGLTCSQPNYGFPAFTSYKVQVGCSADMSDMIELDDVYTTTKIDIDASILASTLTALMVEKHGKTEADFPMEIPVYMRLKAVMSTADNKDVAGTEILSNTVKFQNVKLLFSLPPVTAPEKIYLVGHFNNWDWGTAPEMVPVYDTDNVFWYVVYISEQGIKFNTATAWDGGEKGFAHINIGGSLAGDIIDGGGNIASSNPGWYLMALTANVVGRDIVYDAVFEPAQVWLMGPCIDDDSWSELNPNGLFTTPTTADGWFVSPKMPALDGSDNACVRAYVKVPGYDWWKTEFIVYTDKIEFRGKGGDQARQGCAANSQLHLNFTTGEGKYVVPED